MDWICSLDGWGQEKGAYYLNQQKAYFEDAIRLGRLLATQGYSYYDLAGIYAFQGERDKAFENLKIFNQREKMTLEMVTLIKSDPLLESIRDEPEFRQIVRDVEDKYRAEHERVKQWLEK